MEEIMGFHSYRHFYITVDSDLIKGTKFNQLADFACSEMNKKLKPGERVVSISEYWDTCKVTPRMDNTDTWYTKEILKLSVYVEEPIVRI